MVLSTPGDFQRATRWIVIGNSASGKSTLAQRIGHDLHLPVFDLDPVHWHADGRKRDEAEAVAAVEAMAAGSKWVLEGVYGWLAQVALAKANALVWLDLAWEDCLDGLLARGLRCGMTMRDQDALLDWASAYWHRTTSSSFAGHERLYDTFAGPKAHRRTRQEIDKFLPRQPAGTAGAPAQSTSERGIS